MAEYVDFHYMPLEGKITGKQVLKQTEDAINDLGQHVYEIDIDDEKIQEAIDTSNQAIETAEEALAVVTTNRAVWYNSVTELREAIIDNGIVAAIKGYAFAGDEGQAFYVVREKKSGDVDDGKTIIFLDAGNVAEIIANTGITNMFDFDEDGYLSQIVDGDISNQYGEKKRLASYEGQQEIVEAFNDVINASLDIKGNAESARNSAEIAKQASDSLIQYLDTRESITAPIVDPTLTISGAAADAEATGIFITNTRKLLNATNNLTEKIYLTGITWELGSFSSSGNVTTNDKRIRTNSKIKFAEPVKLKVIDGYRYAVNFYASSTSTYHDTTRADGGSSGWKGVNDNYTIEADTWLTITIAKTAESGEEYTADPSTWCNYVYVDAENHVILNAIDSLNVLTEYNSQTELKDLVNIAGAITTAGADVSSTAYHRSDYIPMLKGTVIIYTDLRATNLAGISAYDSNKVFDSTSYVSASSKKSGEWVMPFDGYVRLCCRDTELSTTASFKAWNRYNYALYSLDGKVENIDGVPLSEEWKEYLATKEPEIKSALVNIGDAGESFTFVTDCHIPRNNMLTPTIIRTLEKVCPVNYHINGGDFIDINTDSAQSALNVLWQWKDEMHGMTEYCVRGNHDSNNYNGENPTNAITVGQFYAIMDRQIENIVNTNGKTYYCIDNDSQKIRLIVLDSSLADKTEMYAWFSIKLTELDSTWTILVIQHYLWGSTTETIHTNGQATINAINAVYSNIQAEFIGILAGHTHVDYNAVESVNGYHLIARTKNYGTGTGTTSLAIDYVTIDKTAETINFLRIGDGSNLSLSY